VGILRKQHSSQDLVLVIVLVSCFAEEIAIMKEEQSRANWRSAWWFMRLLLLVLATISVNGQGTLSDFERAEGLREKYRNRVFRSNIDPRWIEGSPRAWYKVEVAAGEFEFVVVNAAKGTRTLAFDHKVIANAIGTLLEREFSELDLPLRSLRFGQEGQLISFKVNDRHVKWDAVNQVAHLGEAKDRSEGVSEGQRRQRRLQRFPSANSESPDKNWRVEVRNHNVWLKSLKGGETVQLSFEGNEDDRYVDEVYWSPNSTRFIALRRVESQEHIVQLIESAPKDQLQPKSHTLDYLKPGDRVAISKPHLFEVGSKSKIPVSSALFGNPYHLRGYHWSIDSQSFFFVYNQRGHQVLRVLSVDGFTGDVRTVVEDQSSTFIDYAYKQFSYYLDDESELIWMSERDGWNHLYLFDLQSGELKNPITQGDWVVRHVDYVDVSKRQIWFRASGIYPEQDPYYLHACRINFDGTGLTLLTEADGTHAIHYSPDRGFIIATHSRVDRAPVTELRRGADGTLIRVLETSELDDLKSVGWRIPERFVAKGRDGETNIYGVIYRPSNYREDHVYPVIEHIYAGPHGSHVPKDFRAYRSSQRTAELGFIVVRIDGMGTSNRSKVFHDVCWKNLKDAGFPDRILWMQAAAKQYPNMDLSRVGIYGGSAGGQNTVSALLNFPESYKVGVADCGCHDNRMDKIWWNELWMGWPIGPHYSDNSNVTHAANLKGKLFLTVGELDRNVDPASTLQLVDALVKAEKDFDFMMIPGAGHGVGDSLPYLIKKREDFFVRHLHGLVPRRNEN
jgi:dipeptidyl-peptidase 4